MKEIVSNHHINNLSTYELTKSDITLLEKGLNFVPTKSNYNLIEHNTQLQKFERRLQLHFYFNKHKQNLSNLTLNSETPFRGHSNWQPKILNPTISKFCSDLNMKLLNTRFNRQASNLTKLEKQSLHNFKINNNIIIKKADKGGGITILNKIDYQNKIETMLSDTITYTPISHDNSQQIFYKSNNLIKTILFNKGRINSQQFNYLCNYKIKTPTFYGIPKIHKVNIPLRPIVSQINGPTKNINLIVDKYLEISMKYVTDLLLDTTEFLNKISNIKLQEGKTFLITADIVSLYTNIPHEEGAQFVSEFYEETLQFWTQQEKKNLKPISKLELYNFIIHILHSTTFEFNNKFYKQNFGTTMGAKFSVKFANIYMFVWFRKYFNVYPEHKLENFLRFIDDIFATSNYSIDKINTIITSLNSYHNSIKFEFNISQTNATFLDTSLYIQNNQIFTDLFIKPTDKKQYLHFSSSHPNSQKTSIPKSQLIRYRRIITDDNKFLLRTQELKTKFTNRGYPIKIIDKHIQEISNKDRLLLLKYKTMQERQYKFDQFLHKEPFLPLIITYHPQYSLKSNKYNPHKIVEKLVKKYFSQNPNPQMSLLFKNLKPQIIFSRGHTISNTITRSKFSSQQDNENINILIELLNSNN